MASWLRPYGPDGQGVEMSQMQASIDVQFDDGLRRALDDAEQAKYLREWRERHASQPHGWARLNAWLRRASGRQAA